MADVVTYHHGCRECGWATVPVTLPGTPYAACPLCGGEWAFLGTARHDPRPLQPEWEDAGALTSPRKLALNRYVKPAGRAARRK